MRKRNIGVLFLCAFLLALPFLAVAEETFTRGILWPGEAIGQVVVLQNGANLRQGGSTNYNVIARASRGDIFFVVDQADSGWYALRMADGTIAFVSPKMVEFTAHPDRSAPSAPPPAGAVVFADPVVEARIRASLGKPGGAIMPADMETVYEFTYDAVNDPTANGLIHDLSDLALCKNLRVFHIGNQPVESIEPLRELSSLQEVVLFGCSRISDVSALGGKMNLSYVWLDGVSVSDASMVLSLPNLRVFYASGTQVTDISALSQTSSLTTFHIHRQIDDLSPLLGHPHMREIGVARVSRELFAEMAAAWPNLAYLDLFDSDITGEDLHLLGAHRMEAIRLERCPIGGDLSALAGQQFLFDLRLINCRVTDIAPLSSLTNLDYCLDLRGNAIRDISPVASLQYLQHLYVPTAAPYTFDELQALMPHTQISITN